MEIVKFTYLDTPIGALLVARNAAGISAIHFAKGGRPADPRDEWTRDDRAFSDLAAQLSDYFAAKRRVFDLPLAPAGTPFQLDVWNALRAIPYGATWSYAQLAAAVGRPGAARAVGAANGANPLPIVVPCHRVIGSNGTLTGFGGGLPVKKYLLDLERGDSLFVARC